MNGPVIIKNHYLKYLDKFGNELSYFLVIFGHRIFRVNKKICNKKIIIENAVTQFYNL